MSTAAMLPTGRLFGRISKKGPNKKWSGRTNLRPDFGQYLNKKGRKVVQRVGNTNYEVWNMYEYVRAHIFVQEKNNL
jgi:hypothetical protein